MSGISQRIIQKFCTLSQAIGKERVVWRYDPILLSKNISPEWHIEQFQSLCKELKGFTDTFVISFLDEYKKLDKTKYRAPALNEMFVIGETFAEIARKNGLRIQTCAEEISVLGISKGACIDKERIKRICGYPILAKKDRSQRGACLCAESIDIGEYDTCNHLCGYCYANNNQNTIENKLKMHDPRSPLLVGNLQPDDTVYLRKAESFGQRA